MSPGLLGIRGAFLIAVGSGGLVRIERTRRVAPVAWRTRAEWRRLSDRRRGPRRSGADGKGFGAVAFGSIAALSVAGISTGTLFLASAGRGIAASFLQQGPSIPSAQTQRLNATVDPRLPQHGARVGMDGTSCLKGLSDNIGARLSTARPAS